MTMGRVAALHRKWVRYSPKGAMCAECQELNALYSLCVDGASVKVPERLEKIPESKDSTPFVLDVLHQAAEDFAARFQVIGSVENLEVDTDVATDMIIRLLSTDQVAISEYEIITKAVDIARKHNISMRQFLSHINFAALTTAQKYAVSSLLGLTSEEDPYVWNRYDAFS